MLKELQLFLLAILLLSCGLLYRLTLKSSCLLSCLASNKSQQGLGALLGKGRSVVFLETSERTEPPPLVACAVESAAEVYPERPVVFFMKGLSHSMQMPPNSTSPAFSLLSAIDNVFLFPLDMKRLFEDTPLFSWYTQKPAVPQSCCEMCPDLESLQDAKCKELLRQVLRQELEHLRILKHTKIQLQNENQELQRINKMLRRENNKLQKEKEKMQKVQEEIQKNNEKLQKENERLHAMICQLQVTASQSQQHIVSLSTQMQQQARLITSQEMTQTSSCRKVKGSPKDPKTVNINKKSSIEESEDSQDEQHKVPEAQGQNISLWKLFRQTLGNKFQETVESMGRKRDAKEVPTRTFRHFMKQRAEKKRGKFSAWFSKASDPSLPAFSSEEPRSLKEGPVRRRCSPN